MCIPLYLTRRVSRVAGGVGRQLLMCRTTLGKSFLQFSAMKMAHAPPGHHSVVGRPSAGGLCFPEYVVYRGEQVRPAARPLRPAG